MKTLALIETASTALQATNPHTLFEGTKDELQYWLSKDTRTGIILWVDMAAISYGLNSTVKIPTYTHTARVCAIVQATEADQNSADLAKTEGLEELLLALWGQYVTLKALPATWQAGNIRALRQQTVEGFGGLETTLTWQVGKIC